MRHAILVFATVSAAAVAADQPATELRLGLDGGITHGDKVDVIRDDGTTFVGGVEARPMRLDLALVRTPWGIGTHGGVVLGGDSYYGRSHGDARGDIAEGIGGATTVDTRSFGVGIDAGYALPIAARLTAEALLSQSYFGESLRINFLSNNNTRTREDDFGAVGWESALKLGLRYALAPAWSVGLTGRVILWNRASARFNNEDVRYRQRGGQLGVDVGYRF